MNINNIYNILLVLGVVALMASCGTAPDSPGRTFMPDMQYSQAYEYYVKNPALGKDSLLARKPVEGTISRGLLPSNSANDDNNIVAYRYKEFYGDSVGAYNLSTSLKNPVAFSDEVLKEGQALYTVNCMVCHGAKGAGDGSIVTNGAYPAVPAYADRLPTITEGQMFHSITYGRNLMGSYSSQLSPEERWKVIYYIQKLGEVGRFAKVQQEEIPATEEETTNI